MTMTPAPLTQPYHDFMAAMPDDVQPDLELSGNIRAALEGAMAMGWALDGLITDAQAVYRRGGGTGAVITRFRTLASRPAAQPKRRTGAVYHEDAPDLSRHGFRPDPDDELSMFCVCQLPKANGRHRI